MKLRLKKLDWLIIRSFIGPFIVTFILVLFAFTIQFYWLYMDELIGKGLGAGLMLQLLLYMSTTLVPVALPLGILLASIMTFGELGENYELVAIKSSGISLFRFMLPLTIFIFFISIGAFFFNNNVIPVTNLKAFSLLYDMRNSKPTMSINEGIFNREIDNFSIRIGKKEEDGKTIRDIVIYDHSDGRGNRNMVLADSGKMYTSANGKYLIFELNNGWRYEESNSKGSLDQTRMHFGTWYKSFDMSKFSFSRTDESRFNDNHEMMNIVQLKEQIDSSGRKEKKIYTGVERYFKPYLVWYQNRRDDSLVFAKIKSDTLPVRSFKQSFLELIPDSLQTNKLEQAISSAQNIQRSLSDVNRELVYEYEKRVKYQISLHQKFTLTVACLLLFLIGAPLGAIIRKGGLGMPVVVAIGFFIVYFITSSTGEKLAAKHAVPVWQGIWLSTFILIPIAAFILWQARNDSPIFTKESYLRIWQKVKAPFIKKIR